MQISNTREEKGREIANTGQVRRLDENTYKVNSQSGAGQYDIHRTEFGWTCSCPDYTHREVKCKHIFAVEFSQAIRVVVQQTVIKPHTSSSCISCGSESIVKNALRHNKYGDIQTYKCKACGKRFSINIGFEKMRATPQTITQAMQLYFTGESLRNVQKFLRLQGVNISHVAVLKWIRKYVGLMERYLDKITPNVSDTWRADELYLKVKGNMKYLFAMMDDETRFWIAQQVTDKKGTGDVQPLFRKAKEVTGKTPAILVTDGAHNFHRAYNKEYWTHFKPRTEHIQDVHFHGERHNNKMERMNGEVRDREKVMRSLKTTDTPILKGMQIYHNYIRPHEGLEGKTPAEKAGIKVEGMDKWMTLIQNASGKA